MVIFGEDIFRREDKLAKIVTMLIAIISLIMTASFIISVWYDPSPPLELYPSPFEEWEPSDRGY